MTTARALVFASLIGVALSVAAPDAKSAEAFPLVVDGRATPLVLEPEADRAIVRAAGDVCADIERVAGVRPELRRSAAFVDTAERPTARSDTGASREIVLAGVVGHSPVIDRLATAGQLDLTGVRGAWETYVLQVVPHPFPGVDRALVIAGSDRRGAIYGLYEISNAIGVSPWYWWADVAPRRQPTLTIPAGVRRFGPPSVKYRGVFLNDEDWGLQPWAAKTFEPETGNIGPKTYARLFELLLRLRANSAWPAMHAVTTPFNANPANARLADDYGIVMGSSHAEPMLRDNVGEWKAPPADYNYVTNRAGVRRYWEERVEANGRNENIYTLGMRGVHDSAMQGPKTDAERIRVLEQVFADQRALLAEHVSPEVTGIPQMFCAYKEVLALYRQGLAVPDDVTIVWPDDNFGYVRNFASPAERPRAGGFGVYYHISYLGRPLSYLWLCTTPPALIWEEMTKAFAYGADRIWIVNVGDLKPAEIGTEFFLDLAWNVDRWSPPTLPQFLQTWAAREFGAEYAGRIAATMDGYYRLNFQRKPEHLQWWLPRQPHRPSPLTDAEVQARLDAFARLRHQADSLRAQIPPALQDAFFELVCYPVTGSALANDRYFRGERGEVDAARAADAQLTELTRRYNEQVAGGKWRRLMSLEPADGQWASMRIEPWTVPSPRAPVPSPAAGTQIAIRADAFVATTARNGAVWTIVPGLGRSAAAVTVLPYTAASIAPARAASGSPALEYAIDVPAAGDWTLETHLLPTHPISGDALRIGLAIDRGPMRLVALPAGDDDPGWAQGVLDAERVATSQVTFPRPGRHTLEIYAIDPGVVLDGIVLTRPTATP